ncbi:MAG: hypothetical protein GXY36_19600 [Chloroflexi bacterium]|nr:hypothetical protein [Chloroflexota bacterium]
MLLNLTTWIEGLVAGVPLVEALEFLLIGLLGFMPLILIHIADRKPRIRPPRLSLPHLSGVTKTSFLIVLADWTFHLPF